VLHAVVQTATQHPNSQLPHHKGCNVDHLKFRTDLTVGLVVKYSMQHKMQGQNGDDNSINRLTEWHFPQTIPPTEKKSTPTRQSIVCNKHDKRRETIYYC
jgi:hypothetical protein